MSVSLLLGACAWLVSINLVTFEFFRADKQAAIDGEWRIPEARLLWLSALGGIIGAQIARRVLRHKTRKQPFVAQLWAIALAQMALVSIVVGIAASPQLSTKVAQRMETLSAALPTLHAEPARPRVRVRRGVN